MPAADPATIPDLSASQLWEPTPAFEPTAPPPARTPLRATIEALEGTVRERDDISRIVLDYAAGRFDRAALFVIKKETLVGWAGGSNDAAKAAIRGIMVPLNNASIFKTVYETRVLYCGGVPQTAVNNLFFNALGEPRPERVIVVPFVLKEKVACALYVDGGDVEKDDPATIGELYQLARSVASAFESLILKTKRAS